MIETPKISNIKQHIKNGDRLVLDNNYVYRVLADEESAISIMSSHKIKIEQQLDKIKAIIKENEIIEIKHSINKKR